MPDTGISKAGGDDLANPLLDALRRSSPPSDAEVRRTLAVIAGKVDALRLEIVTTYLPKAPERCRADLNLLVATLADAHSDFIGGELQTLNEQEADRAGLAESRAIEGLRSDYHRSVV